MENSASLGSYWNNGPSGWDFPVLTEHQLWLLLISNACTSRGKNQSWNDQLHVVHTPARDVILMLMTSPRRNSAYSGFSGSLFHVFFSIKLRYLVVSKKKNPLFVWGWDIKTLPSWSPFVITRQPSDDKRWSRGTYFSIPSSHESWSEFVITRQGSWCQSVILVTDFSITLLIYVHIASARQEPHFTVIATFMILLTIKQLD